MDEKTDSVLVEDALAGNGESFTALCQRYYPAMVAVARSVLEDRHLAEDAAQQGFASLKTRINSAAGLHRSVEMLL